MNGEMSGDGDTISIKHASPLFVGKREIADSYTHLTMPTTSRE